MRGISSRRHALRIFMKLEKTEIGGRLSLYAFQDHFLFSFIENDPENPKVKGIIFPSSFSYLQVQENCNVSLLISV